MKRIPLVFSQHRNHVVILTGLMFLLIIFQWTFNEISVVSTTRAFQTTRLINTSSNLDIKLLYRRQSCSCTRPLPKSNSNFLTIDEISSSLCSHYSTLRGPHQRIISISMHGPRENSLFALNTSVHFLYQLIDDMKNKYPEWILRIYHDQIINDELICAIECAYHYVDFCNTSSLGNLGSLSSYIPAKIWRFLPIGDELVDIMASRDLDSPITQRELDAVNEWISSDKAWHVMRDHPLHFVPMVGGMWGFRPAFNRIFASEILRKILDRSLIIHFGGRGDQRFLTENVWPHIQNHVLAHDSFLCNEPYGNNSHPWPTRRPHPSNDTGCFVGCGRPCCHPLKYPFGQCPLSCRPKNHTDWVMC